MLKNPQSKLGKLSIKWIILFFAFLGLFFLLVKQGERGGPTFFSNPKLTIPMLIAGFAGVAGFITGLTSIIKLKERSIYVYASTLIGLFVLLWILAEILFPH